MWLYPLSSKGLLLGGHVTFNSVINLIPKQNSLSLYGSTGPYKALYRLDVFRIWGLFVDRIKMVVYLEYVIISVMLIIGLFPLLDAVTSIFIILFLFVSAMALLYFRSLFLRQKTRDFDE
jgi:hypothetical protein